MYQCRDQFRPKVYNYKYPLAVDFAIPVCTVLVCELETRVIRAVAGKPLPQLYTGGGMEENLFCTHRAKYYHAVLQALSDI